MQICQYTYTKSTYTDIPTNVPRYLYTSPTQLQVLGIALLNKNDIIS